MSKVIVERSRIGGKYARKGRTPDVDDLPRKESMKRPYGHNRKTLNENLNPLIRFLHSKIGKSWNKTFSEICTNIKLDTAVQKHVRDHVFDFVLVNVRITEDNKVEGQRKYSGEFYELRNDELYVHPETGILKKYKNKNTYKHKPYTMEQKISHFLDRNECKFVVEKGIPYKLYIDKLTKDFTIKQKATAAHAKIDFNSLMFNDRFKEFFDFLQSNRKKLDLKHVYFQTFFDLYDNFLEEKAKKEAAEKLKKKKEFSPGETVEFSTDGGKTFTLGIINRAEAIGKHEQFTYWITCGTENKMVSGFVSRYIIRYPKNAVAGVKNGV